MHEKTISCVNKADALIAQGDEDSLRYACLQLRMGIERLFYELIPLYAEELPTDILKKWQPRQVIDALLECDPHVEGDIRISFVDSDDEIFLQRQNKAVTKQLINRYWHKLGSYLHASMTAEELDLVKLSPFLRATVEGLRAYSADKILSNIRSLASFKCECGRTIRRNSEALKIKPYVTCPDVKCGAMWQYAKRDGMGTFTLVTHSYTCPSCKAVSKFGAHLAVDGLTITCCNCEANVRLRQRFSVEPIHDEPK